jgi:hypothetical protein
LLFNAQKFFMSVTFNLKHFKYESYQLQAKAVVSGIKLHAGANFTVKLIDPVLILRGVVCHFCRIGGGRQL